MEDVEVTKLDVGDYGCQYNDGTVSSVFFERKGLGDLYGTLTSGYKRFKKEMERAGDKKLILVIEGGMGDFIKWHGKMKRMGLKRKPQHIISQVFTLYLRYGLTPHWCGSREEMAKFIVEYYCAEGRELFLTSS